MCVIRVSVSLSACMSVYGAPGYLNMKEISCDLPEAFLPHL